LLERSIEQYLIGQQRCGLGHASATFLQSSALEIRLELLPYEIGQRPIGRGVSH
jgi:hypothetical protein